MGYYQFMDGKKYDRNLLDAASALLEGKSVGKFTIRDAERIYGAFLSDKKLTATERRTLHYLIHNQPWNAHAKKWLVNELEAVPVTSIELAEYILEEEFGLHHLKLQINPVHLQEQKSMVNNIVLFEEALRMALNSFFNDGSHQNSIVKIIADLYDIPLVKEGEFRALLESILRDHLKHATLTLIPQLLEGHQETVYYFPTEGELVRRNWVFGLSLHDIPSWYFWSIIDREGKQASYNYGAKVQLPTYRG